MTEADTTTGGGVHVEEKEGSLDKGHNEGEA